MIKCVNEKRKGRKKGRKEKMIKCVNEERKGRKGRKEGGRKEVGKQSKYFLKSFWHLSIQTFRDLGIQTF